MCTRFLIQHRSAQRTCVTAALCRHPAMNAGIISLLASGHDPCTALCMTHLACPAATTRLSIHTSPTNIQSPAELSPTSAAQWLPHLRHPHQPRGTVHAHRRAAALLLRRPGGQLLLQGVQDAQGAGGDLGRGAPVLYRWVGGCAGGGGSGRHCCTAGWQRSA